MDKYQPLNFCANLSLLFTEHPLIERFAAARAAGFTAVEIQFPYECSIEELQAAKNRNSLELVLINVPAGDLMSGGEGLAAVPEKREAFHQALAQCRDYAEALGVRCINVLPGRCLDKNRRESYLATLQENLALAADTFHPLGITTTFEAINTEDMPGFLISNSTQMEQILDQVQHPGLAMQYDIYHMAKMGQPVAQQLPSLARRIGHIQFADCPGRGEPGSGELNFDEIFTAIASSDYRGWVGAEYRPGSQTEDSLNWLY